MPLVLVMTFVGATMGAGVWLIVRGAAGSTTDLGDVVAALEAPRSHTAVPRSRGVDWLAGAASTERDRDLAICGRDTAKWVEDRLVWALLGFMPGIATVLLSSAGVVSIPIGVGLAVAVFGAVGGFLYARIDLRSDAVKARREFRHALSVYLELVTILISGGAGVETAMYDAAAIGRGAPFRHLRSALSAAQVRREEPWHTLGVLGERLGVRELEELEASMTLAGGGARVTESLEAKAAAIRLRDLADVESEAQAKSETMVLPVALMFAGFLLLIGYPALAALSAT